TLGYPNDAMDTANLLVASLARRDFKRVGVGSANRRPFLFNTGIGFDAAVIRRVERYGELKRYFSHPLHVVAATEAFLKGEGTKTKVQVELDTGETIDDVRFAIVSKLDPYTFLGRIPLRVAPSAGVDRPLALTAFRSLDMLTLVGSAVSAMNKGEFL